MRGFIPESYLVRNMSYLVEKEMNMLKRSCNLILTILGATFFTFFSLAIASEGTPLTPDHFQLGQNYPNPFNPTTQIDFSVPARSNVVIKVYNILGQEIRTLVNGQFSKGVYTVEWDGANNRGVKVASGVYIYKLEAAGLSADSRQTFVETRKMILVR
jgi:hypothetical protein